ncbi:MAG: hypothetical protein AMXMBFR84_18430 [Candidatus Hydrogenedentota bacterium]
MGYPSAKPLRTAAVHQGFYTPIHDRLLYSSAFQSLTNAQQIVLIEMYRDWWKTSQCGANPAIVFAFAYNTGRLVRERAFYEALKRIVALGFFESVESGRMGLANRFRISRLWQEGQRVAHTAPLAEPPPHAMPDAPASAAAASDVKPQVSSARKAGLLRKKMDQEKILEPNWVELFDLLKKKCIPDADAREILNLVRESPQAEPYLRMALRMTHGQPAAMKDKLSHWLQWEGGDA